MDATPKTIVISDLHIGSRYFLADEFDRFIAALPPGADLVLNGDVVGTHRSDRSSHAEMALDALRRLSKERRIIWVRGNHDDQFELESPAEIKFVASHQIGKRLLIVHGHSFYRLPPHVKLFKVVFGFMYLLREKLGANSMHVAFYAKRFPRLYDVFRRHVAANAVRYAKQQGFAAVTCGHVHYAEDSMIDGIRYINTGAWTEQPTRCLYVDSDQMVLLNSRDLGGNLD